MWNHYYMSFEMCSEPTIAEIPSETNNEILVKKRKRNYNLKDNIHINSSDIKQN